MKTAKILLLILLIAWIGFNFLPHVNVNASDTSNPSEVIYAGLELYTSGGVVPAFERWLQGGIKERQDVINKQTIDSFKYTASFIGNYKNYEQLAVKDIGKSSKIYYLSLNHERGVIFARFHVYQTSRSWVVQNMDFNTQFESILPRLDTL